MAFVKFASAEAQVLGFKGSSAGQLRTASLSKFGEYQDYRTDDDYLYVRVRAISSRVNKNHDGWPSDELQKSWRTFLGKPIFIDHHNSDPSKARGVVVDAALHVEDMKTSSLDPYYAMAPDNHKPPTWIELLLEIDAKTFPKLAKAVIDGDIDGVSMGCNVERSRCSVCSNWARAPEEYCKHIVSKGAYFDHRLPDGTKVSKRSYEDCYDIGFFEISCVFDPADETALVRDIRSAKTSSIKNDVYREAGLVGGDPGGTSGEYDQIGSNEIGHGQQQLSALVGNDTQLAEKLVALYQTVMSRINDPVSARKYAYEQIKGAGFPGNDASQIVDVLDRMFGDSLMPTDNLNYNAPQPSNMPARPLNDPVTSHRTAERNPAPQSEALIAPEHVDTLRKEQVCPICGSQMEDGICEVCNFQEPPEGFDNPDLQKAQQRKEKQEEQQAQQPAPPGGPEGPGAGPGMGASPAGGGSEMGPTQPQALSMAGSKKPSSKKVTSDMSKWRIVIPKTAASNDGGRVNAQERAILPATRQNSDKPSGAKVVSDSLKPVESNTKENTVMNPQDHYHKFADGTGASPAGSGVDADKRVDVTGVGGVDDSPEAGTKHVNVEKEVDIEGIPTMTWSGDKGDSLGQHEPVTTEVGSEGMSAPIGQPVSHVHTADGTWGDPGEGSGKTFPDHEPTRIDLESGLLEEVGDPTMTWSGTDGNAVTRQQEPKTNDLGSGGMNAPIGEAFPTKSLRSHIFRAMKLAETEVELGLTDSDQKWDRAAELEEQTPSQLDAVEGTLAKVRTAGLRKSAAPIQKKATRMPSLQPQTQTEAPASGDEQLFLR